MTVQNVIYAVLAVALLGFIIYRQLTWRVVTPSRMWRMPIVIGVIGVFELSQVKGVSTVTATDMAILGGELVLALGIGAAMGALAHFRSRPQRESDVASGRPDGQSAAWDPTRTVIESKTGGWGAALWAVMIAARIGIEFGSRSIDHSALIASMGVVLLVVAANRVARVAIIAYRMDRKHLVAA